MPTEKKNKIKYGLTNVYYSVITEDDKGTISYGTPKREVGAVTMSLNSLYEQTVVPADDDPSYAVVDENNGYEGDFEFQNLSDEFKQDVFGDTKDENGVIIENKDNVSKRIALMFEFSGDVKKTRHLLYNCSVKRPKVESGTKGSGPSTRTDTITIKASPAKDTGHIKAKSYQGEAAYDGWYSKVYTGAATTTTEE